MLSYTFLSIFVCVTIGKVDWSQNSECQNHREQSPINVFTEEAQESDRCVVPFKWDINYQHNQFKVENNGHTIEITPIGSVIASFKNIFKKQDHHKEYYLAQYHFHWGSNSSFGSEHAIDDEHYPLEVHFVHFSKEDNSINDALEKHIKCINESIGCKADDHSLGVISILFDIKNEDNPAFDAILSDSIVDKIKNYPSETEIEDSKLMDLINNTDKGGYYSYEGSLTTPPCFEIVRWFIMKQRSYISEAQMERFRKIQRDPAFFESSGHSEDGNFRPIQTQCLDIIKCDDDDLENDINDGDDSEKYQCDTDY